MTRTPRLRTSRARPRSSHSTSQLGRWAVAGMRRLRIGVIAVVLLAAVLGGRLVQLQAVQAAAYSQDSLSGRLRQVSLPAVRGSILDSSGVVLAASTAARNVYADQTAISRPRETAALLAPYLNQSVDQLLPRLQGTRKFVYLAKRVQPETWRTIAALKLPGIASEQSSDRLYAADEVAANVLGFVGSDGRGLSGLEQTLDKELSGSPGTAEYEVDAGGRQIPLGMSRQTDPIPGHDVQLTINRLIQWKAQQELAEAVKKAGAASGTVVVMEPYTGNIVALATVPTFNPNNPTQAKPEDRGNRAVSEVYEPGSTGKAISIAAAMEEGQVTPETPLTIPNRLPRGGKPFADHNDHPTQYLTLAGVMAQSSNIGTILATENLSPEVFDRYYRSFGLGARSGSGLPGESPGIVLKPSQWSPTTRYTMAFGQGYSVTALQMASAFATIANNGVRMPPRIVAGITDDQQHLVPTPIPPGQRVISSQTAQNMSLMLEQVTTEAGTAPMASISSYRVAGKTGTANRVDPETGRYNGYTSSFIGYAPADADPAKGKLVVAVTLQDPKNGHFGGALGGPVFASVMSFALAKMGIPATGSAKPSMKLEWKR